MSRLFSIKYIPDSALLPVELEKGCLYFVGDEQVIIVDNGDGPVIYGANTTPLPYSASDSSPSLKEQIDILSGADIQVSLNWWYETVRTRRELSRIETRLSDLTAQLQEQATSNAEGILNLAETFKEKLLSTNTEIERLDNRITDLSAAQQEQTTSSAEGILNLARTINSENEKFTSEIAALARTITKLHPYAELDETLIDEHNTDPLDNETVETDAGQWVIQQTYNPDGTMTLELQAVTLKAETLTEGDTVAYEGANWTVESVETDGEILTLTLRQ